MPKLIDWEDKNPLPPETRITITRNCGECLVVERSTTKHKATCKHPSVMTKKFYAVERRVNEDTLPDWCPL